MADLQPIIFPPAAPTVVTIVNDSGAIIVSVPETAPIIETPVETIIVVESSTPPATETVVVETPSLTTVIAQETTETIVVVAQSEIVVVTEAAGPQGPRGPAGSAGGSTFDGVAGQALSGQRVVKDVNGEFFYADQSDEDDAEAIVGITTGAASNGAAISAQVVGEMQEGGWTWTIGQPVFVTGMGQLTQTPPTTGAWCRQVAVAVKTDTILIDLRPPIYLG